MQIPTLHDAQLNAVVSILGLLLAISETLPYVNKLRSNGLVQLILSALKIIITGRGKI